MRAAILTTTALLVIAGCDRIPGTEANRIAKGEQVAAALLIDPSSAQFRKTFLRPGPKTKDEKAEGPRWVVCGEINGKNRNGAYVGFSRFLADPESDNALLEPMENTTEEEVQRAMHQCTRGANGPIFSEADRDTRLMQCQRAKELVTERASVVEFNATYDAVCGALEHQAPAATS